MPRINRRSGMAGSMRMIALCSSTAQRDSSTRCRRRTSCFRRVIRTPTGASSDLQHVAQRLIDARETLCKYSGRYADSDTQVPVHAEPITGDDEYAVRFAQARCDLRRIDGSVIPEEGHAARLWRHETDTTAMRL